MDPVTLCEDFVRIVLVARHVAEYPHGRPAHLAETDRMGGRRMRTTGAEIKKEDLARPSPLSHKHFNILGRYHFAVPEEVLGASYGRSAFPRKLTESCRSLSATFRSIATAARHQMPMTALADTCGSTIPGSGVTAHHVEAAHAKNSWAAVRAISVTKPVPGKAIRQLLDQCAQRQTHDLLLMVEGRSAEALEASAKGFSHRALDLIVRLQADCPPNERQKPLPRQ